MTSEGHPRARLQHALAAGNLAAAEQAGFDVSWVPLSQARALVELYAEKGDRKLSRRRSSTWAGTYEADPSLVDVVQVAALLAERASLGAGRGWRSEPPGTRRMLATMPGSRGVAQPG